MIPSKEFGGKVSIKNEESAMPIHREVHRTLVYGEGRASKGHEEDPSALIRCRCILLVSFLLLVAYVVRFLLFWHETGTISVWYSLALAWTLHFSTWLCIIGHSPRIVALFGFVLIAIEGKVAQANNSLYSVFAVWAPLMTAVIGLVSGLGHATLFFAGCFALATTYLAHEGGLFDYFQMRDGYEGFLRDRFFALILAQMAAVILYAIYRHLSESNRSELKRKRLIRAKTSRNAAVVEVLGNMAHEVNNPLAILHASLIQYRMRLRRKALDNGHKGEILSNMEDALARMNLVVENLSTFAKGDVNEPMQNVAMRDLLQLAKMRIQEKCDREAVRLDFRLSSRDSTVLCRQNQILFTILVLLDNAVDAVHGLNGPRIVRVKLRVREERCRLEIEDRGAGIDPSIRDKVFQPFFSTKVGRKSLGMNLSICQGIIREHEGQIGFSSLNQGTRFWFELGVYRKED